MDVLLLSRLQFALTIMFHYLFPPLTIGMSIVLVYLEAQYLRTRAPIYRTAGRFWTRLFGLNFAVGVATGIVMEFQFGTNWAAYSRFVGDVFGSALAAEGIFAFFLESGFLAVLVFGWDRVGPKLHFLSTAMVALGSIFSSIWIVAANSWQQTPAGHHLVQIARGGEPALRAEIVGFWDMVFNPSTVHRLVHVWIGSFILGSFFILSISAWYLLRRRHEEFARRSFAGGLIVATAASLAALVSGHFQSRNVYRHQPAKLAAFEAHYRTGRGDLVLFGIPDDGTQTVRAAVAVPGGLSFLIHDDFTTPVLGLDRFRPEHRPPVPLTFASYRLMVVFGVGFIALTLAASVWYWRGRLFASRPLLWAFVIAVVPAMAANQLGWVAAEVGRQPWVVQPPILRDANGEPLLDADGFVRHGTTSITLPDGGTREVLAGLTTADGVSESVSAAEVLTSGVLFGAIYLLLGVLWVVVLDRKIRHGPDESPGAAPGGVADAAGALLDHRGGLAGGGTA
ncbi:MAG TPA: cytochrome ubiquinol oxidase subunit I [Gemmatimonadales bacterium]|nr:cytochrome ubiquinol oxidase subunit I [Gemmatimonadales bacterium]